MKLILVAILIAFTTLTRANDLFDDANEAYKEGNYLLAISLYDSLNKAGYESENLYFNLGNAFYKTGDIGSSRFYYEKAKRLAPYSEDLNYNLDSIIVPSTLDRVSQAESKGVKSVFNGVILSKSRNFWSWSALVLITFGFLSLIYFFYSQKHLMKKIAFYTGISSLIIGITSLVFSFAQKDVMTSADRAIVMTASADVLSEPSENAQELFVLHEGTAVDIIDSNSEWIRVEVDNKQGWMKLSNAWKVE